MPFCLSQRTVYSVFSLSTLPKNDRFGKFKKHREFLCCCSLVTQSCPSLCEPMDCGTPGFPVFHHPLDLAQTHVYRTFVGKVTSLIFNMLSKFVIVFPPRHKHLLTSWLQSLTIVIFAAQKNKICHCFHFSPLYLP